MELFVESLTRNLAETTASSPFMYMFLPTNLRRRIDGDIEIMLLMIVQNLTCFKDVRPKLNLNHVWFPNMYCAN